MNNNYDDDIRMLMRRDSVSSQLIAFAMAAIYGVISAAAALNVRGTALSIARRLIYSAELEANQYRGFMQMCEIGTITMLAGAWLVSVLIVWHHIGRQIDTRLMLRKCGVCCLIAAAVYAVFYIADMLL